MQRREAEGVEQRVGKEQCDPGVQEEVDAVVRCAAVAPQHMAQPGGGDKGVDNHRGLYMVSARVLGVLMEKVLEVH